MSIAGPSMRGVKSVTDSTLEHHSITRTSKHYPLITERTITHVSRGTARKPSISSLGRSWI